MGAGAWGRSVARSRMRDFVEMARNSIAGMQARVGSWLGRAARSSAGTWGHVDRSHA
jgi:hypothetical protein